MGSDNRENFAKLNFSKDESMRSLFAKLFFSFLAAMIVAAAISAIAVHTLAKLSAQSVQAEMSRDFAASIARHIVVSGQAALDTFNSRGPEAFRSAMAAFTAATGTQLMLIDKDDRTLTGEKIPPELSDLVAAARRSQEVITSNVDGHLRVAGILPDGERQGLVVAAIHRPGPPPGLGRPPLWPAGPPPASLGFRPPPPGVFRPGDKGGMPLFGPWEAVRLAVMALMAAGVGWLLARSFANPLTRLRRLSRQIAAGDFSARIGTSLAGSAEEIVALGRDFDTMAEATEQLILARQRLLGDISHELRSPLARLTIALELVRQRFKAMDDANLATIEKEAARLNELISNLLALTRLEGGASHDRPTKLDLPQLIRRIVADAKFEGSGKAAEVVADLPAALSITGHAELLHRAIENTVRNAVKYTAAGTVVSVSLSREGEMAVVVVADHGPGVPDEKLSAIFQPFYRLAPDRDRQSGGTGLGLAIAQQTALHHGGRIEAANREGGGLVVRIHLPLAAPDLQD